MSGQTRLVEDTAKPLMIHLPLIPEFGGRSNEFQAAADFLKGLEKRFTDFYAAKIDLDKDTIYSLLSAESFLNGQEAYRWDSQLAIEHKILKPSHSTKKPKLKQK